MSSLAISLDMDRVQSSVQAAIRPAVEAALAETDIQAVIKNALQASRPKSGVHVGHMLMMGCAEPEPSSLLESLVRAGIRDMAKHYVADHLRAQKGEIEEAFRKMMMGSADRLVRSFAGAVESALGEDWGFDLSVEVKHTVAEKDGWDE